MTVVDAGVVIAVLDANDAHHQASVRALRQAREAGERLIIPASAYAECLVAPSRAGAEAVATVDRFIDALPALVEPVSREIGATAAALRAAYGARLRLPDALVLATARSLDADHVLTTDARWPAVEAVPVQVVSNSD